MELLFTQIFLSPSPKKTGNIFPFLIHPPLSIYPADGVSFSFRLKLERDRNKKQNKTNDLWMFFLSSFLIVQLDFLYRDWWIDHRGSRFEFVWTKEQAACHLISIFLWFYFYLSCLKMFLGILFFVLGGSQTNTRSMARGPIKILNL